MNSHIDISRRHFLTQSLLASSAMMSAPSLLSATKRKRPNILLIMADDMGFSDIGCYGGEIRTPNINSLAERGLRFTQFYNNGICVPTRASLLTGLYSQQVGVFGNSPIVYNNCVTLAEMLRTAGYRTLMVGKWHAQEIPVKRGFDRHYGLCDGCINYFNPGPKREGEPEPGQKRNGYPRRWAIDNQEYFPYVNNDKNFYTTDAFADYALRYLDEYKNEDKPFFLYVAFNAPHYPLHAWPKDIARYRGKYMIGWDELRRQRFERIRKMKLFDESLQLSVRDEGIPDWNSVADKDGWDLKMAVYAAMIDRMDWNVGRILQKIKKLGEEDNTLVIFLSDNGGCAEDVNHTPGIAAGPVESYCSVDRYWANASNTPFRKYKNTDHEGGICTPFIASWPGVIKQSGQMSNAVGHLIDLMPTFVELSGASYPTSYSGHDVLPMEGRSLVPALTGEPAPAQRTLCWRTNRKGHRAIRRGNWKLVAPDTTSPWQLYNLEKDRVEMNDLAASQSGLVRDLSERYTAWENKVGLGKDIDSLP